MNFYWTVKEKSDLLLLHGNEFKQPSYRKRTSIFLLKFINNSWRENKGNHYRERGLDVWFYNYHKIQWTFALIFSKNCQCFETLYQTLERVFHKIPKHFEVGLKKDSAAPCFFNPLLNAWISDETLLQTSPCLIYYIKPQKDLGHGASICYVSCSNNDFSDACVSENLHGIILSASQIPVYIKRKGFDYLIWCQYSFGILIVLVVTDSRVLNTLSGNFTKKTHPEAPRFASWLRSRVFLIRTFEYYSILILSQYGHKTVLIICDFETYESFYYF